MSNYNNTDKQIHWLSQILAKAGRTFVPKQEDDSHTNLYFDALDYRIVTRWIETPKGKVQLSLNLVNLCYEWRNERKEMIQSVSSVGKSISDIELELEDGIKVSGISESDFSHALHYEIPSYSFDKDVVESIKEDDIKEWTNRRRMANMVCSELLDYFQAEGEVRIWPHHFDTGFYAQVSSNMSIGFGWAMEDSMAGHAYFYMSGDPTKGEIDFSKTKELPSGKWILGKDWNGAILTLDDLDGVEMDEMQFKVISYLKSASNWYLKV